MALLNSYESNPAALDTGKFKSFIPVIVVSAEDQSANFQW